MPKKLSSYSIRSYCIRNKLFSCGSNYQYTRMFEYNDANPANIRETATMIWICSETDKTIEVIESDLKEILENE